MKTIVYVIHFHLSGLNLIPKKIYHEYTIKKLFWIPLICFYFNYGQAQATKEWDRRFGGNNNDLLTSVTPTNIGGYILAGTSASVVSGDQTQPSRGGNDYWIVRISNHGGTTNFLPDKRFGGAGNDELAKVVQTLDGGFLLAGTSTSGMSGDKSESSRGGSDYWIVKTDVLGNKQWDKTFGGIGNDRLTSAIQTSDGGYLLGGYSDSRASGDKRAYDLGGLDYWAVKIDAHGNRLWDVAFGGGSHDFLYALIQTSDGGYLLAGSSLSGPSWAGGKNSVNRGATDYWIVKVSSSGSWQWDAAYGGNTSDQLTSAIQTKDGGYLLAGWSLSEISGEKSQALQGSSDYWIVKINNSGNKLWDKAFGGNNSDDLTSVIQTPDNGYLLSGTSVSGRSGDKSEVSRGNSDYWVVKTDPNGGKIWDKSFGGTSIDYLSKAVWTSDGGFLLFGYSDSNVGGDKSETSRGGSDFWVVKMIIPVQKQWDRTIGGNENDFLTSSIQTRDGGYLLAGYSFSGKFAEKSEFNLGGSDWWLVKTNADGRKEWDKTLGGSRNDELYSVVQTSDGGYLLAGMMGGIAKIVKLNYNGVPMWTKNYKAEKFVCVIQTTDGGFLLGGLLVEGDNSKYYVVKTDVNGNQQWNKTFGGNGLNELASVIQLRNGGYLLGGSSSSNNRGGIFNLDYWIVEIDSNGVTRESEFYGGNDDDILTSVMVDVDGTYLLSGTSDSDPSGNKTAPGRGLWVVKLGVGRVNYKQWDKTFGSGVLKSAIVTPGGYLLAGNSSDGHSSEYFILRINSDGIKQWIKYFGGDLWDDLTSVIRTKDDGYLLAGSSNSGPFGDKTEDRRGYSTLYDIDIDYWIVKTTSETGLIKLNAIPSTNRISIQLDEPSEGILPAIFQAAPNPFREQVSLSFKLQQTGLVSLQVYDMQGKLIADLFNGEAMAGHMYDFQLTSDTLPPGMYLARLRASGKVNQLKILLIR